MFLHLRSRHGVSLVEMLVAVAVMAVLALSISTLAVAVHSSNAFAQTHAEAVQHARVALGRIEASCQSAYATPDFPGFWTISTPVGSHTFPDALVVWKPESAAPANIDGPPLVSELVVYTFDANQPNRLLEVTLPDSNVAAPALSQTGTWITGIAGLLDLDGVESVQLTDLLRVGNAVTDQNNERGVVRFETRYHPTQDEWTSYQDSSIAWSELTWPQNLYGGSSGLRQSWCRMELQLVPRGMTRRGNEAAANATAFFGSASLFHAVNQ